MHLPDPQPGCATSPAAVKQAGRGWGATLSGQDLTRGARPGRRWACSLGAAGLRCPRRAPSRGRHPRTAAAPRWRAAPPGYPARIGARASNQRDRPASSARCRLPRCDLRADFLPTPPGAPPGPYTDAQRLRLPYRCVWHQLSRWSSRRAANRTRAQRAGRRRPAWRGRSSKQPLARGLRTAAAGGAHLGKHTLEVDSKRWCARGGRPPPDRTQPPPPPGRAAAPAAARRAPRRGRRRSRRPRDGARACAR
jgi:hypothetical protein